MTESSAPSTLDQCIAEAYRTGFKVGLYRGYTEGIKAARSELARMSLDRLDPETNSRDGVSELAFSIDAAPIEVLELPLRTYNCLMRADIFTVGDVLNRSAAELSDLKLFGDKSLIEVTTALRQFGLSLKKESSDPTDGT